MESQFVEFKVDYSKNKNLPIGESVVASNAITAGGRVWSIVCFPSGITSAGYGNGEYLSLSVVSLGNPPKNAAAVRAIFTAVVLGTTGAPSPPTYVRCSRHVARYTTTNGADAATLGWAMFMKRSYVESDYLAADGRVTFLCGIVALDDGGGNRISVPASDLGSHLGRHLLDCADAASSTSDVSFSVGGETFHAHRAVLAARSPVFRAQLLGAMADARMDRITLHGVQPAAFRVLLRFMYTDDDDALALALALRPTDGVGDGEELLRDLLAAADMYHLDRLKLVCAQKLWDRVSVETVAATLGCAEMHSCPELKKRCIDFLMVDANFKKVALTEGYLQLMQSFPSVIDEIRARVLAAG